MLYKRSFHLKQNLFGLLPIENIFLCFIVPHFMTSFSEFGDCSSSNGLFFRLEEIAGVLINSC